MPLTILRDALLNEDTNVSELLAVLDENRLEWLQSEHELESIYLSHVDHASLYHVELFLAVLHHLLPDISPADLISWFDLILRPALKDHRLSSPAMAHARELVLAAVCPAPFHQDSDLGKVEGFCQRLFDLYLLDAFNETSEYDVLEWADLDAEEQQKRNCWKANLQTILLQFSLANPSNFISQVQKHFLKPSSRVQLLILLNSYASRPEFHKSAETLAQHPLASSLLSSLLLDNSSTVCSLGLTLLGKLLPVFAVYAPTDLKLMLPRLLAILGRVVCWRQRVYSDDFLSHEPPLESESEGQPTPTLQLRSDLGWERLDTSFQSAQSTAPSPTPFFTVLYYLFPCNVLRWLRNPVAHLESCQMESPYTVSWSEALDENDIRNKAQVVLKSHICHPLIIERDAQTELAAPDFWRTYDVARIVSGASLLDIRNAAVAVREMTAAAESSTLNPLFAPGIDQDLDDSASPSSPDISLETMIKTSILLKSGLDLNIGRPSANWIETVSPSLAGSPTRSDMALPADNGETDHHPSSSHLAQVIANLQKELLLLRNELNFELWLGRENTKNIGRLYREQYANHSADVERLGLYTKLRKYRAQVMELQRELRDQRQAATASKDQYADWNSELQKKLREFREEKKAWISQTAAMRTAEKEAKAQFAAQAKLLDAATKEVSELQIYRKEVHSKVLRLHDYERQIEEHVKNARACDEDFEKFKARGHEMEAMRQQYKQMEIRVQSYQQGSEELKTTIGAQQERIRALQIQVQQAEVHKRRDGRQEFAKELDTFAKERFELRETIQKQQVQNTELQEEVEELRSMMEYLKAQATGKQGLVGDIKTKA